MADTHQELQNAIQAMNKIVAIRVVQKKRGEVVAEEVVRQVVESSNVDELVQFIETTIASENEKKLTPPEAVDNSSETDPAQEPKRTSPDEKTEVSTQPSKSPPLDLSNIHRKIQPERKESIERPSMDFSADQANAEDGDTGKLVIRQPIKTTGPAPLAVEEPESNKPIEAQPSGIEVLETGFDEAVSREKDTRFGKLMSTTGFSEEVPTERLPEKEVSTDPPELVTSDEFSDFDELVDDSKAPERLLVLCAVLLILLSVFVALNYSEIETLLLQWFSRIEHWITSL